MPFFTADSARFCPCISGTYTVFPMSRHQFGLYCGQVVVTGYLQCAVLPMSRSYDSSVTTAPRCSVLDCAPLLSFLPGVRSYGLVPVLSRISGLHLATPELLMHTWLRIGKVDRFILDVASGTSLSQFHVESGHSLGRAS